MTLTLTVEALAEELRRIDPNNDRTKTGVAIALLPFIERHIAAGKHSARDAEIEGLAKQMFDAQKDKHAVDWERQWQPTKDYWIAKATCSATPKPADAVSEDS